MKPKKQCKHCGITFVQNQGNQRYCTSLSCKQKRKKKANKEYVK